MAEYWLHNKNKSGLPGARGRLPGPGGLPGARGRLPGARGGPPGGPGTPPGGPGAPPGPGDASRSPIGRPPHSPKTRRPSRSLPRRLREALESSPGPGSLMGLEKTNPDRFCVACPSNLQGCRLAGNDGTLKGLVIGLLCYHVQNRLGVPAAPAGQIDLGTGGVRSSPPV